MPCAMKNKERGDEKRKRGKCQYQGIGGIKDTRNEYDQYEGT